MKNPFLCLLVWGCCLLLLGGCHDDDDTTWGKHTVLIYMAADNNLYGDALDNIEKIQKGMKQVDGRVVIYIDALGDLPRLLTIKGGGRCEVDTLVTYSEEDSASPEVLKRAIDDMKSFFPAASYSLIMWSHGMGWLPPDYNFPGAYSLLEGGGEMPRTKYFAQDVNPETSSGVTTMDCKKLAEAIPSGFSLILFDACFMSSIEVLYELRNKTEYFIASPVEIISDGFPYDRIMAFFGDGENGLKRICQEFYEYYNSHSEGGNWQSGAVALIKASGLEPLAVTAGKILEGKNDFSTNWTYPLSRFGLPKVFFDLGDFVGDMATDEQYADFKSKLDKAVVYKATTPKLFGKEMPADKYSGLSTYIPYQKWSGMNTYYYTYSWPKYVYHK